ncbi:uric acid degradation bifunctional protein TTL isoform X2 [Punica granatum]|uniref:Uric acid degradation bifunctional protein TTL isoform X2 n=1 Tax=Punica granatum TaxID=22663 RepID=A0A6P8E7L7_PUNGR|nr:uric acid degradation bifunctional protein TTL isoform X2 [Punica granatum]
MEVRFEEKDFLACCGSARFAHEMASAGPFRSLTDAVSAARDIWFNMVDVNGWLEAFAAHPQIGESASSTHGKSQTSAQWSKGEQSTALATATGSILQELSEWNVQYRQKFGFIFLICASGRTSSEILAELKKRYQNRPIVEFQIAAEEQMKVTELRLAKLFSEKDRVASAGDQDLARVAKKSEDRVSIISGHFTAGPKSPSNKVPQSTAQTRPPITTHVLDVSQGHPGAGIEVHLEKWRQDCPRPVFSGLDISSWDLLGSSTTDKDGRSGPLMKIVDAVDPGLYRISFNTGKYCPSGFFPFVSIVFEIRETQKLEHFHVPLLLSPFSFTTYRGS